MDTVELPTNFVAIGFSTDMKKGKDLVLVCKFPAQLNPQVYKGYARVQLTWYTFVPKNIVVGVLWKLILGLSVGCSWNEYQR